jgi:hypothetical protein
MSARSQAPHISILPRLLVPGKAIRRENIFFMKVLFVLAKISIEGFFVVLTSKVSSGMGLGRPPPTI